MKYFLKMNEFCSRLGINFSEDMYEKFILYMKELIKWNENINLTSILNEEDIINRHFIDSISIFNYFIEQNSYVCDVGSGAGFPGIPMKIVRDDLKINLIESTGKKAKFLTRIIEILNLKNINVTNNRAEYVSRETSNKYDYIVSRAVARLDKLLKISFSLLKSNGKFIAMKGIKADEELREAEKKIASLGGTLKDKIYLKELNSNLIIIERL